MSDNKFIITIGREFGSGGHEIGRRLSEVLNLDFYDTEFIKMAVEKTGYSEMYIKNNDEKAPDFTGSTFMSGFDYYHPSPYDRIQEEEYNIVKSLGEKGGCIIVGRAADYILRDERLIRIFIYAPFDDRVKRKMALLSSDMKDKITIQQMEKTVKQMDKQRRKFYEYYTDNKWGSSDSYDLLINSSSAGIDGSVKIIKTFVEECKGASNMPD